MKKILSIGITVLGIILFFYGNQLSNEASLGQEKISQNGGSGQRRPVLGPVRRNMQNQAAENKQEMMHNVEQKIAVSQISANWLKGSGVVLFVVGVGLFFIVKKRN